MTVEQKQALLAGQLLKAREDGVTDVGNLPFLTIPAEATTAVLLVHGFAASPWEMRPLADYLYHLGFATLAVRLPGHGTTPEDLAGRRWEDWLDTSLQSFDLLASCFQRVYAAGLSTGSLVLLSLATHRRPAGLVLLSPYLRLRHCLAPWAGWLRWIYPYQERTLSRDIARHYYLRRPLAGVHQINRLIRSVAANLNEIRVPVLAIHGEGDRTVDINSGQRLVERLGSPIRVYKRLGPEAPHVLIGSDNPLRNNVFELVGTFLLGLERKACQAAAFSQSA